MRHPAIVLATRSVILACTLGGVASAQTPQPPAVVTAIAERQPPSGAAPAPELALNDRWRIRVTPRVWFVAPAGDLTLAGGPKFKLGDVKADSTTLAPFLDVTVREVPAEGVKVGVPNLIFAASGAITSSDSSNTLAGGGQFGSLAVAPGGQIDSQVQWSTFQLTGGQVWRLADLTPAGGMKGTTVVDLAGMVGARVQYQRFEFASGGVTEREKLTWLEGIVQARLDVRLSSEFAAELNASLAWAPDRFGGEVDAAFSYTPWRGARGQSLGVQIGYRLLATDYSVDRNGSKTEFNGSLAGLYAGVSLKF